MLRLVKLLSLILLLASISGCGREAVPSPDVASPQPAQSFVENVISEVGVSIQVPQNWRVEKGIAPRLFTYWSGSASLTIWRYERSEPLPKTKKEMTSAKAALETAIKARSASFAPTVSQVKKIAKKRFAIELVGTAVVDGVQKKVHSLHFFAGGSEIVIDAIAPVTEFDPIDARVFTPVMNSVTITKVQPGNVTSRSFSLPNPTTPQGQPPASSSPFSTSTPGAGAP